MTFIVFPHTMGLLGKPPSSSSSIGQPAVVDTSGDDTGLWTRYRFNSAETCLRAEVKMTELGAPASPDLGDIDVLAWTNSTGIVFLIECKRLTPALTVREVILRLEEFRGEEKRKDSLRKHIRRVNWLERNRAGIERITSIPAANITFHPLLVTSESVPMQFFEEMKFPVGQVIPLDELVEYISKQGPRSEGKPERV